MDKVATLALFDKKIQALKLSKDDKTKIFGIAQNLFGNTSDSIENTDLNQTIANYTSEIYEVVKNNNEDVETCKNYIKFAITNILKIAKETSFGIKR